MNTQTTDHENQMTTTTEHEDQMTPPTMDRATLENLAAARGEAPPTIDQELERLNWTLACHISTLAGVEPPEMPAHLQELHGEAPPTPSDTAQKYPGSAHAVKDESGTYRLKLSAIHLETGEPLEFECSLHTENQKTAAHLSEAILAVIAPSK